MADKEAMQMGSRMHRKLQGQMGASYRAEVPLKIAVDCGAFEVSVEGRADGILEEDGSVTIDEIKGVFRELDGIQEAVPVHLAQAKCYAHIYASQQGLETIGVQMTYANLDTEQVRRFHYEYEAQELAAWFAEVMEQYRKWAEFQIRWRGVRAASIQGCEFPYPYREGQKDLAAAVYRTIQREKKLFIQAPTGVGKTMATVFPAVQAVGQGLGDKIFYLTAKTITRTVAQEAFGLLQARGLQYKVVTLTAKEKICPCGEPDCNPDGCPYAKGHFDRINDAVYDLLTGGETAVTYTRELLLHHAEKWQVCPFELSLDLSLWVDAVICDYNYVFDPRAKLKRFFADGVRGDYIFLIDEAHNLVERGREMYSASLYKEDFLEIKRLLKPVSKKAERALEKANRCLLEWKRECEDYLILKDIGAFALSLMNVSAALEKLLEDHGPAAPEQDLLFAEQREKVLDFYFQVRTFLDTYEELDDSYEIYVQTGEDGRFQLKLFCIDTAGKIGECLEKGRGTVLFSATLLPVRYYMRLLSGSEEDYAVYAHSTFLPKRRKVLLGADVSARYTRRTAQEYRRYAEYIKEMAAARAGNYLVFCPSYRVMDEIREVFAELTGGQVQEAEARQGEGAIRIISQQTHMTEADREEFLAQFSRESEGTLIGFCVMGGIFGEGIDLKQERLIGAMIVGTGLPQVCSEREILKQYYDRRELPGFDYAYRYPGMNKVMQSAGRVIRTEEDCGVILLLDDRFTQAQYRNTFPREWEGYENCSLRNVRGKLEQFWKSVGTES